MADCKGVTFLFVCLFQGGLIAAIVAKEEKDLFAGVVFSAAGLDTYKTCCEVSRANFSYYSHYDLLSSL